jgi:hypothetical protein
MGLPDARDDYDEEDHIAGVMMKRIPTYTSSPDYNLLAPLADHLPSTV